MIRRISLSRVATLAGWTCGATLAVLSLAPVAALAADVPVKIKKVTSGDVEGYAPGQTSAVTVMCANGVYGTFLLGDGDEASLLAPTGESCAVSETAVTPSGYASTTVITVSGQAAVNATSASFTVGTSGSTVIVANSLMSTAAGVRLEVMNMVPADAARAYLFADIKFQIRARCDNGYSATKWVTHMALATFDMATVTTANICSVSVMDTTQGALPPAASGYTAYSKNSTPPTFGLYLSGPLRAAVMNLPH